MASTEWVLAALTAILVGVTYWYARSTAKILRENRNLAAATLKMAQATEAMASVAAQSLLLESAPVLTVEKIASTANRRMNARVTVTWHNIGKSEAHSERFGYAIPGDADTWRSLGHNYRMDGSLIEVLHSLDSGQLAALQDEPTRATYLAEYRDIFGNRYLSRYRDGEPLRIAREQSEYVMLDVRGPEDPLS